EHPEFNPQRRQALDDAPTGSRLELYTPNSPDPEVFTKRGGGNWQSDQRPNEVFDAAKLNQTIGTADNRLRQPDEAAPSAPEAPPAPEAPAAPDPVAEQQD